MQIDRATTLKKQVDGAKGLTNLESNFVVKTRMPISLHFFQRHPIMRSTNIEGAYKMIQTICM